MTARKEAVYRKIVGIVLCVLLMLRRHMFHTNDRFALRMRRSHVDGNEASVIEDLHRVLCQFGNYLFTDDAYVGRIVPSARKK